MQYYNNKRKGGGTWVDKVYAGILWTLFCVAILCVGGVVTGVFVMLWSIDNIAIRSLILAVIGYGTYSLVIDLVYRFQRWRRW